MGRSEEIRFQAGRLTLAGTLLLPDPPDASAEPTDRLPWVLLLPSWPARDRDGAFDATGHPAWFARGPMAPGRPALLLRLATALAGQGVASFRYDPRGCGVSEGAWERADLFSRIDDARDALGAMRGRPDLDLARTGVVGHGEGATIALSVAIADPVVGALTLVGAPARSWRDVFRRGVAERGRTGVDLGHPLVAALDRWAEEIVEAADRGDDEIAVYLPAGAGARLSIGLAGWRQAFGTPAMALATMLHRSVTLVHGTADAWVHHDEAELLAGTLAGVGNQPNVRIVPGGSHDLGEAPDQLIGEIAADLAARLVPRPLPPVLLALEERG